MNLIIISSSLSPQSRSRTMAKYTASKLREIEPSVELIDLVNHALPICDGHKTYDEPTVKMLDQKIRKAQGIIIATPVYNFNVSAAIKNLIELTGRAWTDKVVGFICSAGGRSSYMSVMTLANSLMLDFRSVIIPRFVYADGGSKTDINNLDDSIKNRLDNLLTELVRFVNGLSRD